MKKNKSFGVHIKELINIFKDKKLIEPTDKQVLDILPHPYSKAYWNPDGTKKSEEQLKEMFEFFKDIKRKELNETPEEKKERLQLIERMRNKRRKL